MCIALISTAHPDYALILINNRDEYLYRPTAPASWWSSPHTHVLGGRDLLRPEQGTWLGVTRHGRIAVLTNFRETGQLVLSARSRGEMVNAFLTQPGLGAGPESTEQFVTRLVANNGLKGVGGFSLVCGNAGERLAVVSNRTPSARDLAWVAERRGQTTGLSNAAFGDRTWAKVVQGEELTAAGIKRSVARGDSKTGLVEELMAVLSVETMPRRERGRGWESYLLELKNSIFVPVLRGEGLDGKGDDDGVAAATRGGEEDGPNGEAEKKAKQGHDDGMSGLYGTQTQTVLLVDHQGKVTFVERRLYGFGAKAVAREERDRVFEFEIEGWKG